MNCTNPKIKQLVCLYQFDMLTEEQKQSVEAHLLDCDACFDELYCLSPVMELIENIPERFISALQPRDTIFERILKLLKKAVNVLKKTGSDIFTAISKMWGILTPKIPVPRYDSYIGNWTIIKTPILNILVPATATIILAIIFLFPGSKQYSDLAILKKAGYSSFRLKGAVEPTNTQEMFDKAMTLYELNNYREAIPILNEFTEREPGSAFGYFYLGVSLLLTEKWESGIEKLKISANLCQKQNLLILEERCYWYLGNAYLKTNKLDESLIFFEKIIELDLELEKDSQKQLARIKARKHH
ncbi:tetratricopeptide repeat protein [candidate division KSB1 bacterium]|nr:tetratricopeptide repeat protein [candidate division KSB1 bacterium]